MRAAMTYCVGILVKRGLVLAADTRTRRRKGMISQPCASSRCWNDPGDGPVLGAGDLGTTQTVANVLTQRPGDRAPRLQPVRRTYQVR